ncbi:hypothetical protein SAMN02799630_04415 [Paenibacillus sp. UNCCL117]|uniref:hypothetical protein n=1 Tax=unclassified Paenibacillus TaxID=185978 RepID=UPI00088E3A1F|nr:MULTISPECIES: hypothetical protein [unclassified Paenibacillus]SDE02009.1 hypothetical protein SAMN04488602_11724 [Paenibacillus sp. cl123]SFW57124.1 hypothetical protein SAMN02799630_04415 [Paenibacillus sp. UNCCL117]
MEARAVYFKDNFWSSGETEIWDEQERKVGSLDLHSMFQSGVTVRNMRGLTSYSGKFRHFSNKWLVFSGGEQEIGVLRMRFSFMTKRYEYESARHGLFRIESPAFSREYTVSDEGGAIAAQFRRVSGAFSAGAFELTNHSSLPTEEIIVVVMGVHAIQKRQQAAAST